MIEIFIAQKISPRIENVKWCCHAPPLNPYVSEFYFRGVPCVEGVSCHPGASIASEFPSQVCHGIRPEPMAQHVAFYASFFLLDFDRQLTNAAIEFGNSLNRRNRVL